MKRRNFIRNSALLTAGSLLSSRLPINAVTLSALEDGVKPVELGKLFQKPSLCYYPFVRWWWNGDKIEAKELIRELHLLHEAGIGGVEINPISFPLKSMTDDLGKKSLRWLSDEWLEMLRVTFEEAKKLGMTCDLIVGSGWPFGSESLKEKERAQVSLISAVKLEGPTEYKSSEFNILNEADPGVTEVNPLRQLKILSLKLVPDPMGSLDQVIDLSDQIGQDLITVNVPEGKFVFYALVSVSSFAQVINGAPGAAGSILNHMDKKAVQKYLDHMSNTIENKLGPLKKDIRALFTDSMELEGCNWTYDFAEEFEKRNGYDIMPYLPFTMFKVGRLGGVRDYNYGAAKTPEFEDVIQRVRFDFEYTKACLFKERFTDTYTNWCKSLGVKSRAQAYGRGFFPLISSLNYDIPEGESWTTNYLHHKVGEEMSDDDYRRGRGYTMIDKYVSSAAHLTGKREVSCEEMTNTYLVFNITLEKLKIGSDQSIMAGITHSIWHGFNYSPAEAPFPGWVQYGSYYSEKNNWWPYFKYLNTYKARLSSQLENADMYTDMTILPANYDLWSELGVQTDPFPGKLNVDYTSLIWESINKCGGAADYTAEDILQKSEVKKGKLCYGPKKYGTLILPEVTRIQPETLEKIVEFVKDGGRVFCIEKCPEKAPGLKDFKAREAKIKQLMAVLKNYPDRFVLVPKPKDNKFLEWYQQLMKDYNLSHYMEIENPNRFFMQTRYQDDKKNELIFLSNSHRYNSHQTRITFSKEITHRRGAWVKDLDTGASYRLNLSKDGSYKFDFGPADSYLIVFKKDGRGDVWNPLPTAGNQTTDLTKDWELELRYQLEDTTTNLHLDVLKDLKDMDNTKSFCGTAVYRKQVNVQNPKDMVINFGQVHGISEVFVNGQSCGVKWFGRRIYDVSSYLKAGANEIEIHVVTVMGNYMKTMKDNELAQLWVNRKKRVQEDQPLGLEGPVTLYKN